MPTFFFHSEMAGSPDNTNVAGSTLAILDACLVTGFNIRSVLSATVSGGVMTLNYTVPHEYEDGVWLRLDGAPGGTIVQRCTTAAGASSLTIAAPGFADGAVSGSLSTRVAPADWEKPFFDTNKSVFRSKVFGPGSTQFFYRASDTVAGPQFPMFRGFVSMTDVDTGTEPFPTVAQVSGDGSSITRANQAAALPWAVIADGRSVYLLCAYSTGPNLYSHFFGDLAPLSSTDNHFGGVFSWNSSSGYGLNGEQSAAFSPREFDNAPGAVVTSSMVLGLGYASGNGAFPSPVDGGLVLQRPVLMRQSVSGYAIRGAMRGLMHCSGIPVPAGQSWTVLPSVDGVQGRVVVVLDRGNSRCVAFPIDEEWA